ncbi:MAG: hypothetical protein LC655_07700, partial [Bacteroidales bacterium]|nr:hypothetical protein [Bacteroidales bacterium]
MRRRNFWPVIAAILLNACSAAGVTNHPESGARDRAENSREVGAAEGAKEGTAIGLAEPTEEEAGKEARVAPQEMARMTMSSAGPNVEDHYATLVPDTIRRLPKPTRSALSREITGEVYDFQFEKNFDSLLNVYYINRALEQVIDDAAFATNDTLLPDFPDSVYIERLANIPSVIDLSYNRLVKNYINVYTIKRRDQVRSMLAISDYYFPMFEQVFDLYDVPYELKYLAVIESALNPRAVSRA